MAFDLLGMVALAEVQAGAGKVVHGEGRESLVVLLPGHELGDRDGVAMAGGERARDAHDAVGLRVRKGLEQDFIDDREDGGVGADAEGQSGDRDGGESGALGQDTEGVMQIGGKAAHTSRYGQPGWKVRRKNEFHDTPWNSTRQGTAGECRLALRRGERHDRADLTKNSADAGSDRRHGSTCRHGDKARHESILDQVLALAVLPDAHQCGKGLNG